MTHLPKSAMLVAIVLFAVFAAVLLTWSTHFCELHNADSLITAIISTQHVSWYYWGQNRLGNLIPWLTTWIWDLEWNLKAQILLRAFFGIIGPAFFVIVARPQAPFLAAYAGIALAILVVEPVSLTFVYFDDAQPYGTSLFVLIFALLTAARTPWRFDPLSAAGGSATLLFLCVAYWVNSSALLFTGPLFALLAVLERSKTYAALSVLSVIAFALVWFHAATIPGQTNTAVALSTTDILHSASLLGSAISSGPALSLAAGMIAASLYLRHSRRMMNLSIALLGASVLCFIATASLQHVKQNLFLPRYFILPLTGIIALSAILIVEALWRSVAKISAAPGLAAGLLATAMTAGLWKTLPLNPACSFYSKNGLAAATEEIAQLAIQNHATLIGGNYWTVWPAVFTANQKSTEPHYGVTYRGGGASEKIKQVLATRNDVGIVCIGDPMEKCVDLLEKIAASSPGAILVSKIGSGNIKNLKVGWTMARLSKRPN